LAQPARRVIVGRLFAVGTQGDPKMMPNARRPLSMVVLLLGALSLPHPSRGAAPPAAEPLTLAVAVDATRVGQRILHSRIEIPANPGNLTLLYPKWMPGEHGPTGPLVNLVDLHLSADGKEIAWSRDPIEMYQLHVTVPAGAKRLVAEADFLYPGKEGNFTSGRGATDALAIVSWNSVVLYPAGTSGDALRVTPSLRLPAGWSYATSLTEEAKDGETIRFGPVSLAALIDSPVLIGEHFVHLELGVHHGVPHRLEIAADRAADLAPAQELAAPMSRLVDEALALFSARHYDSYRWLLSLSDNVQHFGLEHHQSSDDRREEETLVQEAGRRTLPSLLAHEYVHSWNGKYRRPKGLLSPDLQTPMQGALLWVYEGLTEHLGLVLPARAGLWTPEYYREEVASLAATLEARTGRNWRPLGDTAVGAQMLYGSPRDGQALRRGTDFYDESVFLWLDVDTLLREKSGGKLTLDDFCHRFHGGADSPPAVVPYDRDELVKTLNGLVPYDWQGVFREHVDVLQPHLPMQGLERAGWRLAYNDQPNQAMADNDARREQHDWSFSLGFAVNKEGEIDDVLPESPAGKAGMVAYEKLLGIGGHAYSPGAVKAALAEAKGGKAPIEVVTTRGDAVRIYRLDYHEGARYPHLEAIPGRPDVLADILRPHAAANP
jgi:predicted metalloprotease with PDZ domain